MRAALVVVGLLVVSTAALAAWPDPDTQIGVVWADDPEDVSTYQEGPPPSNACYDIEVACLVSSSSEGAAIIVHAVHQDPEQNVDFDLDPGEEMPEELHCEFVSVTIEYHPEGPPPPEGHAGWGITWTPQA